MNNTDVNIINGAVVGVHLGAPTQDAIPVKPEDNAAYAIERNTVSRVANGVETWDDQATPQGGGGNCIVNLVFDFENGTVTSADKTFEDVNAAIASGSIPVVFALTADGYAVLPLSQFMPDITFVFSRAFDTGVTIIADCTPESGWTWYIENN